MCTHSFSFSPASLALRCIHFRPDYVCSLRDVDAITRRLIQLPFSHPWYPMFSHPVGQKIQYNNHPTHLTPFLDFFAQPPSCKASMLSPFYACNQRISFVCTYIQYKKDRCASTARRVCNCTCACVFIKHYLLTLASPKKKIPVSSFWRHMYIHARISYHSLYVYPLSLSLSYQKKKKTLSQKERSGRKYQDRGVEKGPGRFMYMFNPYPHPIIFDVYLDMHC